MVADLRFRQQADLSRLNTLGLPAKAEFFAQVGSEAALAAILNTVTARNHAVNILGGGSNIVLAGDVAGLLVQPTLLGVEQIADSRDDVIIAAAAGENWHGFTQWTLAQGWCGLENLSLIPGTVGAAPVQNIGAYGVEVADVIHSLRALDRQTGKFREFSPAECAFAYRDSLFKSAQAGRYVITCVRFRLHKQPRLTLDYGDLRGELQRRGVARITAQQVALAVIAIRQSKLPDPARLANAGSFFKNPLVSKAEADALRLQYPQLVAYAQPEGVKLAAGWLIEQAGWKGLRRGAVAVHDRQALVLVNHGGGRGVDLLALAADIRASVQAKFGVALEQEPVILGL